MTAPLSIPPVAQGESVACPPPSGGSPAAFLFGFLGPVRPGPFPMTLPPRPQFCSVHCSNLSSQAQPLFHSSTFPPFHFSHSFTLFHSPLACPESRRVPRRSRFLLARLAGGRRLGSPDPTAQFFSSLRNLCVLCASALSFFFSWFSLAFTSPTNTPTRHSEPVSGEELFSIARFSCDESLFQFPFSPFYFPSRRFSCF